MKNFIVRLGLAALLAATFVMQASAQGKYDRWAGDGLLIRGYDTTAYFQKRQPARGDRANVVEWNGGTWRFATAREAELFRANPTAYAPQFGAYCTGGLSQGHVVNGNPTIWRMHGNKLYLFYAEAGGRRFDQDPAGTIAAARAYARKVGIKEN